MILIEQTQVPDVALPVAEFRDHLQLGSGFADEGHQDMVLLPQLRAAIAVIESEIGKALLRRNFIQIVPAWRRRLHHVLPVAPVTAIASVTMTDADDQSEVIPSDRYRLAEDRHSPQVKWTGWAAPTIPDGGKAVIEFEAGFASDWEGVPPDLRQAVLRLATHLYETRSGGERAGIPDGILAMLKPYRPIRLFGGGLL